MSKRSPNRRAWWRDPIRSLRYRTGAWLLRPLITKVIKTADGTPRPEVPDAPPIGAPGRFADRQKWANAVTDRDLVSARVRAEQSTLRDLYGLGQVWPYDNWEQVTQDRLAREAPRTLNRISTVYDTDGNLHRYAERIEQLTERNDGLVDLVRRIYRHFIDDMPDELVAELDERLGMERRSHLMVRQVPDEGWDTSTETTG